MRSRAVQHPRVPETQDFVRVHSYQSKMVIRPHKSFDEVRGECFARCIRFLSSQVSSPKTLCLPFNRTVSTTC